MGAPAPAVVCPPPSPCGFCARPFGASLRGLCLWPGVAMRAARLVLLVSALVCLSALPLPAVSLLSLLVWGRVGRCVWLSLPGLPRAAPGAARVGWWLLLSLCPGLPWLLPLLVPLLVLVFSFPRPGAPGSLPLAVAPCLPRARGAAPPPAFVGAASRVCWWCWVLRRLLLSRRRR